MKQRSSQHHIDTLVALLLFGVFSVCVLAVLLTGADAYRRLTRRDQLAFDSRTCTQYVATRVRQSDSLDSISVEDFEGVDALVLGDGEYVTRVYCYDGKLMELYSAREDPLTPDAGEAIMDLDWLEMSLSDGLLKLQVLDTRGKVNTLLISVRSGEGGAA